jgi:hypothetical protein
MLLIAVYCLLFAVYCLLFLLLASRPIERGSDNPEQNLIDAFK